MRNPGSPGRCRMSICSLLWMQGELWTVEGNHLKIISRFGCSSCSSKVGRNTRGWCRNHEGVQTSYKTTFLHRVGRLHQCQGSVQQPLFTSFRKNMRSILHPVLNTSPSSCMRRSMRLVWFRDVIRMSDTSLNVAPWFSER